ncbi:MAG: arginine--tRNA ligase [Verrucomicrobia bacterium]|nr:arginine--tRNA ligase [Verrucomicrobiota bacterium]
MIHLLIESRLRAALTLRLPDAAASAAALRPCPDPKFGDYQNTAMMSLAKERKMNPRQLATEVAAGLDLSPWCEPVEIAGPGFLNFRLKPDAVAAALRGPLAGEPLFFAKAAKPRSVVIDFSSPNVAKPMHIGHIRSTALGDCLARVMRLLGHRVVTDNHIGDWGTQFGLLTVGWKTDLDANALARDPLSEMERLYKQVNAASENDPSIRETARQELVKLQSGDPENLAIWKRMIDLSQAQFDRVYGRLRVSFDHTLGESFYNSRLKQVVQELRDRGIARESQGAICVFSDGTSPPKEDPFLVQRDEEWAPNPLLIQKADGAANYATTDLATLAYRWETWRPDEVIYVTDGRQQLHFRQLFAVWKRWQPERAEGMKLEHVWFGSILGDDGKPFKTRSGETVRLFEVLDEAEERAFQVVSEKNPELAEPDRREIAKRVGIGAVKYADLSPNRQSDYVFSWEKMLSLQGNTAPYLQYAHARIQSIFRKSGDARASGSELVALRHADELSLAKHLLRFGITLEAVAAEYRPNYLCLYLYELAGHFARFYESCPVLKAEAADRPGRLLLCEMTGRVLKQGLEVLGIEAPDQM